MTTPDRAGRDDRVDGSPLWHPGLPRAFSAEDMARARVQGGRVGLSARNTGLGMGSAGHAPCDGVGLANSRVRLAQAFGERATLQRQNAAGGGCLVSIDMPLEHTAPR